MSILNGQTVAKNFVPLPGRTMTVYLPSSSYYRHADWLGSSRFASTSSRTMYSDTAFGPFGEPYAQAGTTDVNFTGMDQDTVANLYDFPAREYGTQGRWPSPDLSGLAAVDPTNPQSWNRYAYVTNNPLDFIDPLGLRLVDCAWDGCAGSACFMCGGGGGVNGGAGGGADGPGYGGQAPGVYVDGLQQTVFNTSGLGFNEILGVLPDNCSYATCAVTTKYGTTVNFFVSQTNNGEFGGCDGFFTCWTFALLQGGSNPFVFALNQQARQNAQQALGLVQGFYTNKLTHAVDTTLINGAIFLTAGVHIGAGIEIATLGCVEPSPIEPLTCAAGITGGTYLVSVGGGLGAYGIGFFVNQTLPAYRELFH